MNTKEIIRSYFDAINQGDWEKWLSLFSDDVVFDDEVSGKIEGIKEMEASAYGTRDSFQKFTNTIEEIVVEGDKGMVICRINAVTISGKTLVSQGANFYKVKDDKIVYMASFHDTAPFREAFS